jgi:hypothetical protein
VAQLHLAFPSPITPVKTEDEGKFSDQRGQSHWLVVMVRQLEVRKFFTDLEIHHRLRELSK